MNIINFLLSNWDSVLVIAVALAVVIVLIVKKQYAILDRIILVLVTEAEKQYGGGTGAVKLAAVIDWVYPKIPAVVRLFITEAQLVAIIERVLATAKAKWENNPNISSYIGMTASSHNHNAAQATPGALTFVRGGTLPIVHGDTGTTDAATAKANLGLPDK